VEAILLTGGSNIANKPAAILLHTKERKPFLQNQESKEPPSFEIPELEKGLSPEEAQYSKTWTMPLHKDALDLTSRLSGNGFKMALSWVQQQKRLHKHPVAIIRALQSCEEHHPDHPEDYCNHIIEVESPNAYEADYIKTHTAELTENVL
jgi:hypothetical protein